MRTKISLQMYNPCDEDWNKMTPCDKGRFCKVCNRKIIDFTCWSDDQIIEYTKKVKQDICGQFRLEQLNRPLIREAENKYASKFKIVLAVVTGLFLGRNAQAQTATTNTAPSGLKSTPKKLSPTAINAHSSTIKGIVKDDKGTPIYGASITINNLALSVTDSTGRFKIERNIFESADTATLAISCIGYDTKNFSVSIDDKRELVIVLEVKPVILKEAFVTAYAGNSGTFIVGGIGVVRRTVTKQAIDTVKHLFTNNSKSKTFEIFPNLVQRGSMVKIVVPIDGVISIELLSNDAAIIRNEKVTATKGQYIQMEVPPSLAAGMYYVRIIGSNIKKPFLEKLVVF